MANNESSTYGIFKRVIITSLRLLACGYQARYVAFALLREFDSQRLMARVKVDATFSNDTRQSLVGLASEDGIFVWSPGLIASGKASIAGAATETESKCYEIKFSFEGVPVDDDFVEVSA